MRLRSNRIISTVSESHVAAVKSSRFAPYKAPTIKTKSYKSNESSYQISIKALRSVLQRKSKHYDLNYLLQDNVLEWLFADKGFIGGLTKQKEDEWGKSIIGYETGQWTTKLGEHILKEILMVLDKQPERLQNGLCGKNNKRLMPDWDTPTALYENKARTYTTSGTAGEKILGTPLKYCECQKLYNKPLYIVCMAYQEVEADESFHLFQPQARELKNLLSFYKSKLGISYVRATDLLKSIQTK